MNTASGTLEKRISPIDRLATYLFATSIQIERGAALFRLFAALPIALLMFASRERLPYWEVAILAIGIMFLVNVWIRISTGPSGISPERSALIGSLADTFLLLLVSFLAIRASGNLSTTSEMWLIFPLVILAFVYRSKMLVGIAYAVLLTTWYSVNILVFFDPEATAYTELPIRATFFVLMGVLAAKLGNSLRQQNASK